MKPVYVVTRIVTGRKREGCVAIPNLGVHRSLDGAHRHFAAIMSDRRRCGWTHFWTRPGDPAARRESPWVAMAALLEAPDLEREELRLEVWRP